MRAMKAIIWKELRTHTVWMLVLAVLIASALKAIGFDRNDYVVTMTLAWPHFIAPLFGLLLGVFQVLPELGRDSPAFVIHRPISTVRLFDGKVFAGSLLLLIIIGIPYGLTVQWFAILGHNFGPYDVTFAFPGFADVLTGFVFYLAALLTVTRPVGTYGLPFFGAFACAAVVDRVEYFWEALIILGIFGGAFWIAARFSFATLGQYRPLPKRGRFGLAAALYLSAAPLIMVLGTGIETAYLSTATPPSANWSAYEVSQDGRILTMRGDASGVRGVRTLDGRPAANYGSVEGGHLDKRLEASPFIHDGRSTYYSILDLYTSLGEAVDQASGESLAWYLDTHSLRLLAYSETDDHLVGSLGADGFALKSMGAGGNTESRLHADHTGILGRELIWSTQAAYLADLPNRRMTRICTLAANERIFGACTINTWLSAGAGSDSRIFLATTSRILVYNMNGLEIMSLPSACDPAGCSQISLYQVPISNHYYFWYTRGGHLPDIVVETDSNGNQIGRYELPPTSPDIPHSWEQYAMTGLIASPIAAPFLPLLWGGESPYLHALPYGGRAFASAVAAVGALSALCAYLFGLRCGWDRRGRLAWAFGVFWLGIPGLLMLLALDQWPARET